ASEVLEGMEGIQFCHFTRKDVIRHKLVARVVEAYETRT
ncbi:MAG TPA: PhoH family protein, partial [Alphaproteobacteria bacterium]|nr:PhoH family protein [Alphaproteobacteria bacterium]